MPNLAAGGGNPSGFNSEQMGPMPGGGSGTMGDYAPFNPLMPQFPSQQQWPGLSNPYSFTANGQGQAPMPNPMIGNMGGALTPNLQRAFTDAGAPSGVAASLADFIKSGSGYNPQILQALFAQLQPQINRGEANIMGQFGGQGLGQSSAAAIGMGDYLSQVNLNESQMATQLYEQAIQNYMQVMLGGSNWQSQSGPGYWQGLGESLLNKAFGVGSQDMTGYLQKRFGGGGSDPMSMQTAAQYGSNLDVAGLAAG